MYLVRCSNETFMHFFNLFRTNKIDDGNKRVKTFIFYEFFFFLRLGIQCANKVCVLKMLPNRLMSHESDNGNSGQRYRVASVLRKQQQQQQL